MWEDDDRPRPDAPPPLQRQDHFRLHRVPRSGPRQGFRPQDPPEPLVPLRKKLHLSSILISHDLSVMAETCDKVAIMYAGKMMEVGKAVDVFTDPKHPYAQGLVAAFPDIRGQRTMPSSIPGDVPSLINPPAGCVFHPRCKFAFDRCTTAEPALAEVTPGPLAARFLYPEVPEVTPRAMTAGAR